MSLNSIFTGRIKKIHLVGIGGIGMSGIAKVLLASGFQVSGSDLCESKESQDLQAMGAKIFIGHHAHQVGDADVLVYSSAIKPDNVELIEARNKNLPIIKRALMLAELMRLRCGIAVAGAHGKTTTTSLIGTLMHGLGFDPTIIIGGVVNSFGSNAILGKSQFMVTEADESDGTFLHLAPTIAVVTNIDAEHLDFYPGGIDEISARFEDFLNSVPFYGLVVACIDDPMVAKICQKLNRRMSTYGFSQGANFRAENIRVDGFSTSFDVVLNDAILYPCRINMVGQHNVLNALAAIAVLSELGLSPDKLTKLMADFNGVKRRFTPISCHKDFLLVDDYAHHPTEIKAVLKAAKTSFPDRKILALFQPHRYSRTRDLMEDFAKSFDDCDTLVLTEIYSAQEKAIDNISSEVLMAKINQRGQTKALCVNGLEQGAQKISDLAIKNSLILTLGAGSITNAGPQIAKLLNEKYG